jgi:hypothetical protein
MPFVLLRLFVDGRQVEGRPVSRVISHCKIRSRVTFAHVCLRCQYMTQGLMAYAQDYPFRALVIHVLRTYNQA